ncbi:hypothetical protein AURDEDRAFT_114042 [Auricularia subglabra TFB-10046 SS5]|nr:hypothetical protein AURDEDRAFT_114042 [Auricularia subglabra TFB-10046 SS5]
MLARLYTKLPRRTFTLEVLSLTFVEAGLHDLIDDLNDYIPHGGRIQCTRSCIVTTMDNEETVQLKRPDARSGNRVRLSEQDNRCLDSQT